MRISDCSSDVCSSDLLVVLAAESREELLQRARAALAHLQSASLPEVAKACSAYARGAQRLALICHSDDDLRKKLEQAIEKIERTDAKPFKTRAGVHYGVGDPAGKLCLLRSEEHTSELQSLMRISYAVFCLKKKNTVTNAVP